MQFRVQPSENNKNLRGHICSGLLPMSEEGERKIEMETLWRIYDTVNDWIRFSDAKAIAILGINGVVANIIFSNLEDLRQILLYRPIGYAPLIVGFLTCSVSVLFAIRCLTPTLKVNEKHSLIFFGHVAEKFVKSEEYEKAIGQMLYDGNEVIAQIASQIWAISKVASKKFQN